ncbi:MAG: class I SAM-dependent methyltransferase [Candidatus Hodarchaeota archaeon]
MVALKRLFKDWALDIWEKGFISYIRDLLVDFFLKRKLSFKHPYIIQLIINRLKAKTYLEIGVLYGVCFSYLKVKKKIAVDPKISITLPKRLLSSLKNKFYEMTSDEFFSKFAPKILKRGLDVVFVDGLHTYEQSLKDVLNSLNYLNKGGIIIMHDCNPHSIEQAYPAKSKNHFKSLLLGRREWCGDVWKTIVYLMSTRKDLNIFVIDYGDGFGIIQRGTPSKMLNYTTDNIKKMNYDDLANNRENLLNLKSLNYFLKNIL